MNPQALIACIQINLMQRPLMRVQTVQDFLNKTRAEVDEMIEDGSLPFVFDLALNQAARNDPRIFSLCVAESAGWKNPAGQTKNYQLPEVIGMILPKRDVRSTELKRIFSCRSDHVYRLAKNNFTIARKPTAHDGPNSFTIFHRASVERFLTNRRML
jgi:hypothetical protein